MQYQDLFLRDNITDTGSIPSTGPPCESPDIIPYQDATLDFPTAQQTYTAKTDIGMPIVSPGINNIYLRAYNPGSQASSGYVQLFYSAASLLLLPSQWVNQPVTTAGLASTAPLQDATNSQTIAPSTIALGEPPFLLTSLPIDSNDHYCFIAIVQTSANPVTIPTGKLTNAEFAHWVWYTPAVAWRNIAVVPASQATMIMRTLFGNADTGTRRLHFSMVGTSLPTNSTVAASCTNPLCPIDWNGSMPAADPEGYQLTGFDWDVPAGFTGTLQVALTAPTGQVFTSDSRMSIHYIQIPIYPPTPLEREVSRPMRLAAAEPGEEPVVREEVAIELGTCTLVAQATGDI
jgi:hypothetical protein